MLTYDYPQAGIFWSLTILFVGILWLLLLFHIFVDIFRSSMGGFAKAMWLLFVIVLPFIGAVVYVIVRGGAMAGHQPTVRQDTFNDYARTYAGGAR